MGGLVLDVGIILAYFALISFIGLKMGQREDTLKDFALGGRQIPWWAVMASIIAAETSAATFLGAPTEGFKRQSLAYAILVIGVIVGRYVVAHWFIKPYFRYKVYTVYDFLAVRFGEKTKNAVSGLFLLMRTLASGARLFIPTIVMVLAWQVLMNGGNPVVVSAKPVDSLGPYLIAIVIVTVATAFYTTKGGIKAVIWTDVIQASLMFGSALLAIGILLAMIGGFPALIAAAPKMGSPSGYFATGFDSVAIQEWQVGAKLIQAGQPARSMDLGEWIRMLLTNDYTLVTALIATPFMNMAAFGTDQDMCQRLLTAETAAKARRSLMTAAFMDVPIAAVFTFIGVLLFAFYAQHPELKPKSDADVFANYILNVMPIGVRGILMAGVFATSMGSFSAALNALATSATNDFFVPFVAQPKGLDEAAIVRAARGFTILFAVLMMVVAAWFAHLKLVDPNIGIIPVVLGIAGFILGPMLGVFLLGIFTRNRGSDTGNVVATVVGLVATVVLGDLPGSLNKDWSLLNPALPFHLPYKVSFTWFALIGAAAVVLVGMWWKTPQSVLDAAEERARQATEDDSPLAMREVG